MADLKDALRFTIEAGVVTAVFEYKDGGWRRQSLDANEVYRVDPADANVVIRTETYGGVIEIDRYRAGDGGLTYFKIDDSDDAGGADEDLYRFVFGASNAVLGAEKFDDGVWKTLRLDGNESFSVDPVLGRARVMQTEVEDGGRSKADFYDDFDGDGVYVEVSSADNRNDDVYFGSELDDVKKGGLGADDLYGEGGEDVLRGEGGDDDLYGDDESDDLYGGSGEDELYGGNGDDNLNGDVGDDHLSGDGGDDGLSGGDGADDLHGDAGSDKLTGGRGLDRQWGGEGADRFRYVSKLDSAAGSQRDVITDFSAAQKDRINLVAVDANDVAPGNQVFSWLGSNPFSGVAGQLRYETVASPGGLVIQADTNGDRNADFEVLLLGVSALGSGRIML